MSATRRGFLASLLAGATLDAERLLWKPGERLISIPKPRARKERLLSVRWETAFCQDSPMEAMLGIMSVNRFHLQALVEREAEERMVRSVEGVKVPLPQVPGTFASGPLATEYGVVPMRYMAVNDYIGDRRLHRMDCTVLL